MFTESQLKAAFDNYLETFQFGKSPASLYMPVEYVMRQPGKRVRPVLLLMAYSLFREDYVKALPAALAFEYFHNFTLVHDDIMDAAVLRRGVKAVHARFGTNSAILSGDLMLIESFNLLLQSAVHAEPGEIIGGFSDVAIQICEGQQLDMDFEEMEGVTVDDYLVMIEKKTAVLLGCALQTGALLAGASTSDAELLYNAGTEFGKAFQIQDDILDVYGDEDLVGKRRGGDIVQKKKSILYALAWEALNKQGRMRLSDIYHKDGGNPEVKIQQVLQIFDELDVRGKAESMGQQSFNRAAEALAQLKTRSRNIVSLLDMVKEIFERVY